MAGKNKSKKGSNTQQNTIGAMQNIATAPYNFISLPKCAIPAPIDQDLGWEDADVEDVRELYKEYIQEYGTLSGYIDLTIKNKTPCFIGGNGEEFFAPVHPKEPMIPGSSLRGMIKNILKIVTCGTFRCDGDVEADFHNRRLYYRSIGDASELSNFKQLYTEALQITQEKENGKTYSKSGAKGGFLVRADNTYYICPAQDDRQGLMRKEVMNRVFWDTPYPGACEAYTGGMSTKKHCDIIWNGNWEQPMKVPESVIQAYKEDIQRGNANGDPTRDNGFNLFLHSDIKEGEEARAFTAGLYDSVVPCFYMEKNGNIQHFGFGRFYRVPYKLSIADHVPEAVKRPVIDFADALFGKKELWGSRVYVEDCRHQGPLGQYDMPEYTHPLMSPKPTSFQLYLTQHGHTAAAHWDSKGVPIRGYKLYWNHVNVTDACWKFNKNKPDEDKLISGQTKIRPLKYNNTFTGRIRFSDLSDVELGALLKIFHLGDGDPQKVQYSIGQGKSLGLGKIIIEAKPYITNFAAEKEALCTADGWHTADEPADAQAYIAAFDAYMEKAFTQADHMMKNAKPGDNKKQHDVLMDELKTMLCERRHDAAIATMKIDDADKPFQKRFVLPSAREVPKKK